MRSRVALTLSTRSTLLSIRVPSKSKIKTWMPASASFSMVIARLHFIRKGQAVVYGSRQAAGATVADFALDREFARMANGAAIGSLCAC